MRKRGALLTVIGFVAICGAAAPAVAGDFQRGWGRAGPHCGAFLSRGFFLDGPRLGLGSGYPGLYPPYTGLHSCDCDGSTSRFRAAGTRVVVISNRKVDRTDEARPAASDGRPRADYSRLVERARKLYPQGLPPIESVWNPDGTVQRIIER